VTDAIECVAVARQPCRRDRIMIVDDERAIRRLFSLILTSELPGHEIDIAEDGGQAVELFRQRHQGLLLMDLRMPGMDGRAAFLAIEQACRESNWEMPSVVFCTGFTPPETVRRVVEESCDVHALLAKPVSNDVLLDVVKRRLSR